MDGTFIDIVGYQNITSGSSNKYTIYYLEVSQDEMRWIVKHRYHDFKHLHDQLSQEGHKCPALPPKKFIGSFNPEFLLKRQTELSNWIVQLTEWDPSSTTPDPKHNEALKDFLFAQKELLDDAMKQKLQLSTDKGIFCFDKSKPAYPVMNVSRRSIVGSSGAEDVTLDDQQAENSSFLTDDSSAEDSTTLYDTPKTTLNDFELLKVIGKGSYGKVTLVKKKDTGKLYAMKSLSKPNVKKKKQVEHTRTERRVLGKTKHPFIVHLHYAFQTEHKLYFVLDYCSGGELFFHLSRMEKFQEHMAMFYAAEISLALGQLHDLGIVYRDLKPENILFDARGHVLLADFGLAKEGVTEGAEGANSMCGTPEYLPPEIIDRIGHGTAVDWWALGMVLYEMLTGLPPWYTRNRQKLFHRLKNAPLTFPGYVSDSAQSLIRGLLERNPATRLGAKSLDEVKSHPFFDSIDWTKLYNRELEPPFNPSCAQNSASDTNNFESEFTKMQIYSVGERSSHLAGSRSDARESLTFQGFTYNTPSDMDLPDAADR